MGYVRGVGGARGTGPGPPPPHHCTGHCKHHCNHHCTGHCTHHCTGPGHSTTTVPVLDTVPPLYRVLVTVNPHCSHHCGPGYSKSPLYRSWPLTHPWYRSWPLTYPWYRSWPSLATSTGLSPWRFAQSGYSLAKRLSVRVVEQMPFRLELT